MNFSEALLTIFASIFLGLLLSLFFVLAAAFIVVEPQDIAAWLREAF